MERSNFKTLLLTPADAALIVGRKGLRSCISAMSACIYEDFLRWEEFDKCARVASHSHAGVIELMPISDAEAYTFKYVNGHPRNTVLGLPTVMAFGVLADVNTGAPRFVSELTLTTAIRTAAMSALAARYLARRDSRTMALIGNGAQSEFQALAFHQLLGIEKLRLFDVDERATVKLMRNLAGSGLHVTGCSSVAEAVRGCDIVTTVTADKTNATILTPAMLEPGMHINAVGGDCPGKTELHPGVLRGATVFVEYEAQTRIEGDLQQMPKDFPVIELWRVFNGTLQGRVDRQQITVFDSVGFALEDYSALRFMRDSAQELGLGRPLSLVPDLDDPKDLFSLVKPTRVSLANSAPVEA